MVTVLLVFFVPEFAVLFDQLRAKGELPAATDWLLWFSETLQSYGFFILAGLAILFVVARVQLGTEKGRWFADGLKLKLPLFGSIFKNLAIARFCRVLGTLFKNGVPILKGLEISGEAAGNRVLSNAILQASENITSGESLSVPLGSIGPFPEKHYRDDQRCGGIKYARCRVVSAAEGLEKQTLRRLDLMVKLR